jgi:serine/threonine protein kinase
LDIEALLGQGSSANVYLARRNDLNGQEDTSNGNHVILKVLTNGAEKFQPNLSMLETEVRAMDALQRHPNIVRYHGLARIEDGFNDDRIRLPCLAMQFEYCKGGDLHDKVCGKRFEEREALHVVQAILHALSHIHELGYVHRDIKPENILWADGAVKIADFGLCCHKSDEQEMKKSCGSAGYVAPEIIRGQAYGSNVDCFSVGALLYFIVSGRHAFGGHDTTSSIVNTLRRPLNFQRALRLEFLSESCKQFMIELTIKDPSYRPNSKEALQSQWVSQGSSPLQTNSSQGTIPTNHDTANASTPVVRDSIAQTRPERHDHWSRMSERRSNDMLAHRCQDRSGQFLSDSSTTAWTTHHPLSKATSSICDRRTFQSKEKDGTAAEDNSLGEMQYEPTKPDGSSVKKKIPFGLLIRRYAHLRREK